MVKHRALIAALKIVGSATVQGKLYDFGAYPGVTNEKGLVFGDLLLSQRALNNYVLLDAYEECNRQLTPLYSFNYHCSSYLLGTSIAAWIYFVLWSSRARRVDCEWRLPTVHAKPTESLNTTDSSQKREVRFAIFSSNVLKECQLFGRASTGELQKEAQFLRYEQMFPDGMSFAPFIGLVCDYFSTPNRRLHSNGTPRLFSALPEMQIDVASSCSRQASMFSHPLSKLRTNFSYEHEIQTGIHLA